MGESEQTQQGPSGEPGGEGYDSCSVVGDVGRRQLFVHQAGIGLRARMEDGDPFERCAATH